MSVFGFSTESAGDFLPIIKYDARAGRMTRVDSIDVGGQFSKEPVDITTSFKALADFENIEVGWMAFPPGGTPDFRLVPMGQTLPPKPSDGHKNGVRFMVKLDKTSGGDKPIREISSSARAFLGGLEEVYTAYEAQKAAHPGKLPVIILESTRPIKTGTGATQSTNYQPTFKIVNWAPRGDLVFQSRGGAATVETQAHTPPAVPPSTGSQRAEPPAAKQTATADDDDFG